MKKQQCKTGTMIFEYECEKKRIIKMNLTPEEYEKEILNLCERLKI